MHRSRSCQKISPFKTGEMRVFDLFEFHQHKNSASFAWVLKFFIAKKTLTSATRSSFVKSCYSFCFKRIETKKIGLIKISWGMILDTLRFICDWVTTLTSLTPAVLFYLYLQQRLNILFESRRKIDSVDQQPLWLAAIFYDLGWRLRLYYITFYRMTHTFVLLKLLEHLDLALRWN